MPNNPTTQNIIEENIKMEEVRKMIRHKACLSIPNNHEYKMVKETPKGNVYECIHCKEIYITEPGMVLEYDR